MGKRGVTPENAVLLGLLTRPPPDLCYICQSMLDRYNPSLIPCVYQRLTLLGLTEHDPGDRQTVSSDADEGL